MTKPKFTPGPWEVRRDDQYDHVFSADNKRVCNVYGGLDWEYGIGTARLIASAPSLLTAIENYLYGRKDVRECEAGMREAVAMARGEN